MSDSPKVIGVLTAGGDCPGLNAVIRSVTKTAINQFDIEVVGIRDAYHGFVEGKAEELSSAETPCRGSGQEICKNPETQWKVLCVTWWEKP